MWRVVWFKYRSARMPHKGSIVFYRIYNRELNKLCEIGPRYFMTVADATKYIDSNKLNGGLSE